MYTMRDVERATGFTRDQVRDRVGRVWSIVALDHRRGPKNAVLVGDKTLAVLRRIRELEMGELGPQEAVAQVFDEMGVSGGSPREQAQSVGQTGPEHPSTSPNTSQNSAEIAVLREYVEDLKRDRDHWRELAVSLQTLALPAPRRRWWLPWRRGA
jgi:hypothetical protein